MSRKSTTDLIKSVQQYDSSQVWAVISNTAETTANLVGKSSNSASTLIQRHAHYHLHSSHALSHWCTCVRMSLPPFLHCTSHSSAPLSPSLLLLTMKQVNRSFHHHTVSAWMGVSENERPNSLKESEWGRGRERERDKWSCVRLGNPRLYLLVVKVFLLARIG